MSILSNIILVTVSSFKFKVNFQGAGLSQERFTLQMFISPTHYWHFLVDIAEGKHLESSWTFVACFGDNRCKTQRGDDEYFRSEFPEQDVARDCRFLKAPP